MIFLCLLPAPIPLFQYLNSTHRTNYMSILIGEIGHLSNSCHIEALVDQGCEQLALEARRAGKFAMGIHGVAFSHSMLKPLAKMLVPPIVTASLMVPTCVLV